MDDFFGKPLYEVKKDPAPALAELSAALDSAIAGTQQMPQPAAASYGYGSNILGSQDPHLSDYLRIVYKRRWTALTAFGVIMLSVCLYTFTTTPIYEARAQVLIEKENSNVVTFKEVLEQNQIADDYYQTQYKILQSRALARRVLDELELWNHARFNPPSGWGIGKLASGSWQWLSSWLPFRNPAELSAEDETVEQSQSVDRFLKDVVIAPIRNSRLVDVKFRSPDGVLSANVANALARGYIEQTLEVKLSASKDASDWLAGQLAEQRKHVEQSEQAVQHYRERTDAVAPEDKQNIVVQKLADLSAAVTRAKTERIQKEEAYNQIRSLQTNRTALDTFPAILSNVFIQQQKAEVADLQRQQAQLSEKLGPRHPEMLKLGLALQTAEEKVQGEINKVVLAMRNDYQQAVAQERSLNGALEQQKKEALDLNRKGIEYNALARDAASNKQIFESLLQRTRETGISGELKTSNIRIVDLAETPREPATPNIRNNALFGLSAGTLLALGIVFFFEYVDNRIKSPDEIKRHLGLPFLGMVPALFDHGSETPLINNGVPANFSESVRAVRTNILFSNAEEGGRCLVVTSTAPGEGKTLVATNLAIALAQAGQRVILVDGDMRRPRVHAVFGKSRQPGLSNVLVGTAKVSEGLRPTTVPELWVLPAGKQPPNPAELLGSRRCKDFLSTLKQHFDWVILDTPPVMAVTDSSLVAHLANGVVFVVGAEMTSHHAARRAVEQLQNAKARFVGAVLNRVDLQHNSYYYAPYYRREYTDYYQKCASA